MSIGSGCRIFTDLAFSEPYLIKIGNNVTISTEVRLLTHDNSVIKLLEYKTDVVGTVVIGDNCFIGAGTIILPGVTLGNSVIVGAGSVVTKTKALKREV